MDFAFVQAEVEFVSNLAYFGKFLIAEYFSFYACSAPTGY
jgi:hypothetical protein